MSEKNPKNIDFEEYTENTNTGILYPPKDHSFENLKRMANTVLTLFKEGWAFLLLTSFLVFWAGLLALHAFKPYTSSHAVLSLKSSKSLNFSDLELKDWRNNLIQNASHPQFFKQQNDLQIKPLGDSSFDLVVRNVPSSFLKTFFKQAPTLSQTHLNAKGFEIEGINLKTSPLTNVNDQDYQSQKQRLTILAWVLGTVLTWGLSWAWAKKLQNEKDRELRMTFPFSVLGMIPKKDEQASPTRMNDAFELLRTNISMQRSVFSFSSLTLIWPFSTEGQNEFICRMASDFGKTNKKVLVIETMPNTISKHYASENHKGLTDLHMLIKESSPQSEKENEVFWKMYEYVFGTEDKFYCMPYGQVDVAETLLFEKYNFRRLLEVLKKHFSLVILNAPQNCDATNSLPWTTLNDATLLIANYEKNDSIEDKDHLKILACAQKFLLGGILLDVPSDNTSQRILKYEATALKNVG